MNSGTFDNTLFALQGLNLPFYYKLLIMEFDLNKTLEALLLSTAEPIDLKSLGKIFARYHSELVEAAEAEQGAEGGGESAEPLPERVKPAQIEAAIKELMDEAEVQDKAYRLIEGPSGYQIVTAPQFAEFVRLLRGEPRPMKLSPAAMETLSIVAYRQPVTRAEMEAIRGVSVDGPLNRLIELELVHVTGRAELPGRPIQYGTTDKFLEFTGIKELVELPASDVLSNHQIDDWMRRSEEPEEVISDEDMGLAKERNPDELPLDEKFVELDWQKENVESDAAEPASDTEEKESNV
jgi:segregation and condensation protein B